MHNRPAAALFFIALFLFSSVLEAQELLIEWAVPLKKNLVQLNRREQGGVTIFGKDILVSTRSGDLHLFSDKGTIKKTVSFDGEFFLAPVVADDGNVIVCVSNSIFMLNSSLEFVWSVSGKAPVASTPFVTEEYLMVQFHDNSIYLLDRKTGAIKTAYTSYSDEEVSYMRLPEPLMVDDKYVFGFSSGTIVFFIIRKTGANEEIVPYFRFKTSKTTRSFEKKDFFDLLSIIPFKDSVMFSGGEYGGYILEGKIANLENMKNLKLLQEKSGGYTGFGEGGINSFDENGVFVSKVFNSLNYISNLMPVGDYAFASTTGEGSIIAYSEGYIYLMSKDYSKVLYSIMIPNGVSSKAAVNDKAVYIISDMGVVYKLKVVK
ncbi:MAG TPA: PQQ-binding-like beta-propeller repeat protein [bacterium]|nr:PQQ-binding-like beta-propeller repeat protein [bacterium]